jgi:predicted amidohydrolase YtcJ
MTALFDTADTAELIISNACITTMDKDRPRATAVAIGGGKVLAVGSGADTARYAGEGTRRIDARGRTMVPGLNDTHIHLIRGGLNYNLELRWEGVPSLADAMRMLEAQVARTPAPHWVRVVGGWNSFQFRERRMPTLDEINRIAPETPVFILHLYDRALLNAAALRVVGYTKETPNPPGGEIQRDGAGNPTGLILAKPNAAILYGALAKGPRLSPEDQMNSTRLFMRELNRFGLTSVIDAGGGSQSYPDDYGVFEALHKAGELTVRTAYNLFTQHPNGEREDFAAWIASLEPYAGDDFYRLNGAGEMLVYSGADFEDFRQPRPDLPEVTERQLSLVVRDLVRARWPFRIHATYGESISRFLDVFESIDEEIPFDGLRWIFDHAELIREHDFERIVALGGAIAVQDRMAFQGEYFVERYGLEQAATSPPIRKMLRAGLRVGVGTDATRVSSYNPWVALSWLVTGKTVGGLSIYDDTNRLSREKALELYTSGNAWFSGEEAKKGAIKSGQLADLALLSADYFSVSDEEIKTIEAVLTVVGGKVVYGAGSFSDEAPAAPKASPSWSPHNSFGGGYPSLETSVIAHAGHVHGPEDLSCFPF